MNIPALLRGTLLSGTLLGAAAPLFAAEPAARDQAFASEASAAGQAEIDAAKLALQKSQAADVKTFAQHIIDDHTKANTELQALATRKHLELSDQPGLADKAKAKALDLRAESFDAAYANNQVAAHEKAVQLFTEAADKASDPDLQQFARVTLPVLKQHLQMAQDLAKAHPSK